MREEDNSVTGEVTNNDRTQMNQPSSSLSLDLDTCSNSSDSLSECETLTVPDPNDPVTVRKFVDVSFLLFSAVPYVYYMRRTAPMCISVHSFGTFSKLQLAEPIPTLSCT